MIPIWWGGRLMHHPTGLVAGRFDTPMDGWAGPFAVSILSQQFYETRPKPVISGVAIKCS